MDYDDPALVIPMQWDRSKTHLGNFSYEALARLKPGVTMEQASTDLNRLIPVSIHSFPAPDGFSIKLFENVGLTTNLRPLEEGCDWRHRQRALGVDGFAGNGAVDRMRQCGQLAAGTRGGTAAGAGDSQCALERGAEAYCRGSAG
jgi:hypothetical protein